MGTNELFAIQLMLQFVQRLPAIVAAFEGQDIVLEHLMPKTKLELRAEVDGAKD